MDKLFFAAVILAAFGSLVSTEEYFVFQAAQYTLKETTGDNEDTTTVGISRSGDSADTSRLRTITIKTECPTKVTASADADDYDVTTQVTFAANSFSSMVEITIKDDDDEEYREFFCLTIVDDPGSEDTTIIYIPGNDNCVHLDTTDQASVSEAATISDTRVAYVGPWYVGENGYPDIIDIDVQPESDGDADDINIWLTDIADQNAISNYYGILLDDSISATHAGSGTNGDSVVVENGLSGGEIINDGTSTISDVVTTSGQSFTLQYAETSGTITLVDKSDPADKTYVANDDDSTKVDVSHLFVSSGDREFASWTVCGLSPRKLPTIKADASSYDAARTPDKAIDGNRDPDLSMGGCFISNSDVDPWLQIDLGREFDVKLVLIYPIGDDGDTADDARLDAADVYVGSCPASSTASITSNNVCDDDIGTVGETGKTVIEISCDDGSYGRYVYIIQDTNTAVKINLCEVEVYGDDIHYDNEAKVEFSSPTFATQDDESALTVSISAKRTGTSALTCTTVDVYTDSFTLPGGESGDFVTIWNTDPQTLEWDDDDNSGTLKYLSITIINDNECEPLETFNVFLKNVNGGILGTQSCSSVSIIDDDSVIYALTTPVLSVNEGSTVNLGVSRSGTGNIQEGRAELTFTDGTAQSGDYVSTAVYVDFTAISVSPQYHTLHTVEDNEYEGNEELTVLLDNLEPVICSSHGTPRTAIVTIIDNDSKFEWAVNDDNGYITIPESTAETVLDISREGVAQSKTIDIELNAVDADSSADFSISSNTVSFRETVNTGSVTVSVVDDSVVEEDETFTLTLQDPDYTTGHRNLGDPYRLTVTIQDDDATYSWKTDRYDARESDGTVRVCLVRRGDTSTNKDIQINLASFSSATSGVDFILVAEINFIASSEACTNIQIRNDDVPESTETFSLAITSGQQDVELGDTTTTTVYITDDDNLVAWGLPFYTFEENPDSTVNYVTITKTGTGSVTLTLRSQDETAEAGPGNDYAVATTVTFSGTSEQIPITIYDDDEVESSETFTLTFSGTGVTESTTRITIIDNDATTEAPVDDGLSGGAVAGIAVAGAIGGIVTIVAVGIFCAYTGGLGASNTTAAAAAAAGPAASQGVPLSNYQLGGLNSYGNGLNNYGNGLYNQYGNGFSNQSFAGFNRPQYGFP